MKNAKVIGIDFDDVIVSTNQAIALWHNRVYGTSYEFRDIISWDLTQLWGCSKDERFGRIYEFYESKEHAGTLPVVGAVESLKLLQQNKELHIVTARPDESREVTLAIAESHIPFLLSNFNFTNGVNTDVTKRRTKGEVCLELGVEVLIDDNLDYAINVASVGIPVLLLDSPWNQTDELPENVTRVFSWDEIIEKIL